MSQVWQMYESSTLTVDTQASFGTVTGQVSGGLLTFDGVGSFAQPATADIFSCATGPFSTAGLSDEMLAWPVSAARRPGLSRPAKAKSRVRSG